MELTPLIDGRSISLEMCRKYLGKTVTLTIDQPYGTVYNGVTYEVNYGFVAGTIAPDGDGLDGYFLIVKKPLAEATGICIAIVHRLEDDDDKLVVVPEGVILTKEQIEAEVHFVENFFKHEILFS
jgi:inorganic pyrophosphatase